MPLDITGLFILGCFAVFLIVWLVTAFLAKRTLERGSWTWRIFLVVFAGGVVLLRRSDFFPTLSSMFLWKQSLLTGIIADAITFAGLLGLLWARFTLGSNWSSEVVIKENHELIERGPYQWVRHPIYTSLLVMVLGIVVWSGHILGLGLFIVILVGFWLKSRQEEIILTKYFPQEYPSYKARVKALIPFVL